MRLGLNCSQAKVYLALVQKGVSTAKEIAIVSDVNRQEIYRIMPKLQKLCLAEKILAAPTMWKATPIDLGLTFLMEHRDKETCELQKKLEKIVNNVMDKNVILKEYAEHSFIVIEGQKKIRQWIKKRLETTQISNDVLSNVKDFVNKFHLLDGDFHNMLTQGTQMRIILYLSEEEKPLMSTDRKTLQFSNVNIKYIYDMPRAIFAIHDKREAIISTSPVVPDSFPALITNNPVLVTVLQDYFELLWKTIN